MSLTNKNRYFHIDISNSTDSIFSKKSFEIGDDFVNNRAKAYTNPLAFPYQMKNQGRYSGINWLDFLDKLCDDKGENLLKNLSDKNDFLEILNFNSYFLNARYWENIFENIRLKSFTDLPSRLNSIYICEGNEELSYWYKKLTEQSNIDSAKIYELKLDGKLHRCDSNILELGIVSDEEIKEKALKYWKGYLDDNSIPENLFKGKFEVIKKFNCLDEFVNASNVFNTNSI